MHEAKFTEEIVEAILKGLKEHAHEKSTSVEVRVGEMFHLDKESVLMHYDILTKETPLAGIELDLKEERVVVECARCHCIGGVEDHHLLMCKRCDSLDVKVVSGDQISVEFIPDGQKRLAHE